MTGLTLDAGALIAAERNDRRFWSHYKLALLEDVDITIPVTALAQAWRGNRSARTGQIIKTCELEAFDVADAKAVGLLLARSSTSDIVDASVVLSARHRGDDILTSDPDDIDRLVAHVPGVGTVRRV